MPNQQCKSIESKMAYLFTGTLCDPIWHAQSQSSVGASSTNCYMTEYNKSALTDHAIQENHTIHWKEASVIDRELDWSSRWIKEAVCIRKDGHRYMNRDDGSYQLSHAYYDRFLDVTVDRHIKIPKN